MRFLTRTPGIIFAVAGLCCGASPSTAQVYIPISVSGYNQSVIASAGSSAVSTTTVPFDGPGDSLGFDNVLFQQGYYAAAPASGLPANGTLVVTPGRSYQFGPAPGNNDLQLTASTPTATLTFLTRQNYAALSVLVEDGNGFMAISPGALGNLLVNWSNGQSTNTTYRIFDWFPFNQGGFITAPAGVALNVGYRTNRNTDVVQNSALGPYLLYYDINLSSDPSFLAGASIDSVTFNWPGFTSPVNHQPEYTNVMAISGSLSVPEPSSLALLGAAGGCSIWMKRSRRFRSRVAPQGRVALSPST
jgi:hypothetical protein